VYIYTHIREERTVPDQNNFLCIHQLRLSWFPLLAAYNLLLSTLISIIIPMLFFVPLRIATTVMVVVVLFLSHSRARARTHPI